MMQVPASASLPTHVLARCFNNTSATYKYYWFLSILQELESGHTIIPKLNLFSRMIANAWYTVNYFHISFGKQDLIQQAIQTIYTLEGIAMDAHQQDVFEILTRSSRIQTERNLWHFDNNVPHKFLSPWFPKIESRAEVYARSQRFENDCLYALRADSIEINAIWVEYLKSNARLLKDFCYWNLSLFLQAKNPNVPDIPNKLIKPAVRKSLSAQRTKFWDIVFDGSSKPMRCIYTGRELVKGDYAVEHFIPYSFVSHDLIWNLIPADSAFNSTKSDKLPPLERYFNPFFAMQRQALDIMLEKNAGNKILQDYLTIFPDYASITPDAFRERIQPLITIASNNGFSFLVDEGTVKNTDD